MSSEAETQKFIDEIARLKASRQRLIQQTAEELEAYEKNIEATFENRLQQAHSPYQAEIAELHRVIERLEKEKYEQGLSLERLKQRAQNYHQQLQHTLSEVKTFFELEEEPLPSPITTTEPILPQPSLPVPIPIQPHSLPSLSQPAPLPKIKGQKKSKKFLPLVRTLSLRTLTLSLIVAAGYFGWTSFTHHSTSNLTAAGQVAGVSTDASITQPSSTVENIDSSDSYPQSLAKVPLADTQWEQSNDPDFGINISYPFNTTNRIHIPGGNNLWFLRNNGYMLKISKKDASGQLLDQWMENNRSDYETDYSLTKGTFKDQPAWIGTSLQKDDNSGTYYFVKHGNNLYEIWAKDEPTGSDDGERLKKMITSLTFTS